MSGRARRSREHLLGELGHARDLHELARNQVRPHAPHELAEAQPLGRRRTAGADPGVQDDDLSDALGVLDGEPQPDRAAPVLDDDRRLAQVELVHEPLDRGVVEVVRVVAVRVGLSERPKPK